MAELIDSLFFIGGCITVFLLVVVVALWAVLIDEIRENRRRNNILMDMIYQLLHQVRMLPCTYSDDDEEEEE